MSRAERSVFISYSHKDAQLARKLGRALGKRAMHTPGLVSDASMRMGHSFAAELERALRAASCYVVLVSDAALQSPSVNFEIGAAIGQEKKLIPVFLTRRAFRDAPVPLRERTGILAEHMSADDIADRIVGAIERAAA